MYDVHLLLEAIDANRGYVLSGFVICMIFQVWWLGNAVLVARRDKAYSIPFFCTAFWFAHDLGVAVRFQQWFVVYDHWYLKIFWVGLLAALVLELFFLWQTAKYGHGELLPEWSRKSFALLLVVALLFAEVIHEYFKLAFGDPLFQLDPTLTMLVYPVFGAAMVVRRKSTRGQSATMWWTFTAMTAIFHATTYLWFSPPFQSWYYVTAAVVATLGGAVMACVISLPDSRLFPKRYGQAPPSSLPPQALTK